MRLGAKSSSAGRKYNAKANIVAIQGLSTWVINQCGGIDVPIAVIGIGKRREFEVEKSDGLGRVTNWKALELERVTKRVFKVRKSDELGRVTGWKE